MHIVKHNTAGSARSARATFLFVNTVTFNSHHSWEVDPDLQFCRFPFQELPASICDFFPSDFEKISGGKYRHLRASAETTKAEIITVLGHTYWQMALALKSCWPLGNTATGRTGLFRKDTTFSENTRTQANSNY